MYFISASTPTPDSAPIFPFSSPPAYSHVSTVYSPTHTTNSDWSGSDEATKRDLLGKLLHILIDQRHQSMISWVSYYIHILSNQRHQSIILWERLMSSCGREALSLKRVHTRAHSIL